MKRNEHTNWGLNTFYNKKIFYPKNLIELKRYIKKNKKNLGICGNLRSYGDTCINKSKLISLKKFEKKIKLFKNKKFMHVSSNFLLLDVLKKIVPYGFMIPVTPGSKYVTIGGMISNNVIGKLSKNNQLRYYIRKLEILTPGNKIIICSPYKNKKLFNLTVGGFGLTGTILSAEIKLKKIKNQFINQEISKFNNISEFIKLSKKKSTFSVSWVDTHSIINNNFKGLFYFGEYNSTKQNFKKFYFKNLNMDYFSRIFLILYIKIFAFSEIINFIFYHFKRKKTTVTFDNFFYPQDKWLDWNRCYKNGFIVIQFLVKEKKFRIVIEKIGNFLKSNKIKSNFIIIKRISESGNYLDFFGNGYSISFDFEKNENYNKIKNFFNSIVNKFELKVNLSKDIILNHKIIKPQKTYIRFKKELSSLDRNNVYNNLFSKRLKIK